MTINNLPAYAATCPYIVARFADGELWFWGAYHDRDRANEDAMEIRGMTLTADLVDWE